MGIFKKIYIEVTNCCNLSCSFCHQSRRPKAFMNAVDFADVLKKIKGHTRFIYLHVLGEAMLHPEFERLLGISHRAGLQVNLSTNGTLLNRSRGAILASPAVRQVNVSLHSHSPSDGPAWKNTSAKYCHFPGRQENDRFGSTCACGISWISGKRGQTPRRQFRRADRQTPAGRIFLACTVFHAPRPR
jgi:organic radical activating enzyme